MASLVQGPDLDKAIQSATANGDADAPAATSGEGLHYAFLKIGRQSDRLVTPKRSEGVRRPSSVRPWAGLAKTTNDRSRLCCVTIGAHSESAYLNTIPSDTENENRDRQIGTGMGRQPARQVDAGTTAT
jgi:hypothetical protein